jgi:hypothetical protein
LSSSCSSNAISSVKPVSTFPGMVHSHCLVSQQSSIPLCFSTDYTAL